MKKPYTIIDFCISIISLLIWGMFNTIAVYVIWITLLMLIMTVFYIILKTKNRIVLEDNILNYDSHLYISRTINNYLQLIFLSFIICIFNNTDFYNDFKIITFITYSVFTFISYLVYNCKHYGLKLFPIISSTPLGIIFLLIIISLFFSLILNLLILIENQIPFQVFFSIKLPDTLGIKTDILQLLSTAESDMSFWIYSTVIFTILNIIYIIKIPKYYLNNIKKSYNTIEITSALIIVITVIAAPYISISISNFVKNNVSVLDLSENSIEYLKKLSATNVNNIIKLLLLPYSIGLIICNAFINFRINRANAKKDKMAKKLLTETNEKLIEQEKIEFLINGGKSVELDYIDQIRINSCKS